MLEVPGMTEAALRALTPTALASLRWGLYARALAPSATADIEGLLEGLADDEAAPSKTAMAARRGRRREELTQALKAQASIRAQLLLDDDSPDEEVA